MTDQHTTDDTVLEELLEQVEGDIDAVYADGAYDKTHCYQAIHAKGATPVIQPRIDATLQSPGNIIHHQNVFGWSLSKHQLPHIPEP